MAACVLAALAACSRGPAPVTEEIHISGSTTQIERTQSQIGRFSAMNPWNVVRHRRPIAVPFLDRRGVDEGPWVARHVHAINLKLDGQLIAMCVSAKAGQANFATTYGQVEARTSEHKTTHAGKRMEFQAFKKSLVIDWKMSGPTLVRRRFFMPVHMVEPYLFVSDGGAVYGLQSRRRRRLANRRDTAGK